MIQETRDLVPGIHQSALRWILSEAKRGTKSIGFVPAEGLERASAAGLVLIDIENDDPVGFLVYGRSRSRLVTRIYQCWVRNDARRMLRATAIVDHLAQISARERAVELTCWCAADLDSTAFWEALGFHWIGSRLGGGKRVHWRYSRIIRTGGHLPGFELATHARGRTSERPSPLRQVKSGGKASPNPLQRRFL